MIKVNEYFQGNVMSMAVNNTEGELTVGVMKPGVYQFSTSKKEFMKVVSGSMEVKLPGEVEASIYKKDASFEVGANEQFDVKIVEDTIYTCRYES